jgi:hypothetical protein
MWRIEKNDGCDHMTCTLFDSFSSSSAFHPYLFSCSTH